ncbi:potassium transporter TrkA [Desulfonema ishimotonii]|uniref:Potassium transporter TrkA n=1 Tax=Desulfonema ishimotonii TaxID=45657 RepID=A0A401FRY1_9BACT|nr:potassium channel protein [Desulfonema ishimotonii]GBC59729.1 potassium transporter TrkA [Desulfonema ishimotonii]
MDFKRLHISLFILFGIIAFGTLGYFYVEKMPLFDALYMTIITISTVGFSEIHPLSPRGRLVTMLVISASISIGAYSIGVIVRMFIEGELKKSFERRKMEKQIAGLKNHFIICGYGRIGRIICQELREDNIGFVVIEEDAAAIQQLEKEKYLCLQMDATTEEALLRAGIMSARGLVTAVRSDANNVFITLTAKGLRPDVFVLSRTSDVKNEDKLRRAGANRVVSPYFIGGRRMAQVLKRPTVVDFIDIATMGNKLGLVMDEAEIGPGSRLVGKDLIQSQLRKDFGVIIVAIKRPSGRMIYNPVSTQVLESGDVLVLLGKRGDIRRMDEVL